MKDGQSQYMYRLRERAVLDVLMSNMRQKQLLEGILALQEQVARLRKRGAVLWTKRNAFL